MQLMAPRFTPVAPQNCGMLQRRSLILCTRSVRGSVARSAQEKTLGGLQGVFYGDAKEYDVSSYKDESDDGTRMVPLRCFLDRNVKNAPGVFALYDESRELQFVSFSDDLTRALVELRERVGEERCAWTRVMVLRNRAMRTPATMEQQAARWIDEAGVIPPGNGAEAAMWLGDGYESDPAVPPPPPKNVTSPFTKVAVQRTMDSESSARGGELREMTVEIVDQVLDEVRPYLMADGGNVEVVYVEDGVVGLRLQGNCSTCASSSATMKMGIEKALANAFGSAFKGVEQLEPESMKASVGTVDMHLNMLRGAIAGFGGSVEVVSVNNGVCELDYKGPKAIAMGVAAAIKDQFLDIKEVKFNMEESDSDTDAPKQ